MELGMRLPPLSQPKTLFIFMARGGSSVGAGGLKPPYPRNSMESRGKKEGEEGERKEGGRRKVGLEEEEGR